jgi:hypothetical protein
MGPQVGGCMTAGRPSKGSQHADPELSDLSDWFNRALANSEFRSANHFVQQKNLEKNSVYGVMNGTRFVTLDAIKALAGALEADAEEVAVIWLKAKQRIERRRHLLPDGDAQLSWDNIPWPDSSVRHLLDAQANAAQSLPYGLLGIEAPSLPAIYVRQFGRRQPTNETDSATAEQETPKAPVALADIVDSPDHLLLTGEPGLGKSTFMKELARPLARIWLREDPATNPPVSHPIVPLLLPARALAESASFSSLLAAAVSDVYGLSMVVEPQPEQFAAPVKGARWLVLIDGLDEILDTNFRRRVISAIAAHANVRTPYRFVLTSRPMRGELLPLRQSGFVTYSLESFSQEDLRTFATRWFGAQRLLNREALADSFAREVADGRLREVVSNPLLATLAIAAKTRNQDQPLPVNRLALYDWFCDCIIRNHDRREDILRHMRREVSDRSYQKAEWIAAHMEGVIGHLAEKQVDSVTPSLSVVLDWIESRQPDELRDVPISEDQLALLISSSGLVLAQRASLSFLHQSFAVYLAARQRAARVPRNSEELAAWVERGIDSSQWTFEAFTLALWESESNSLEGVLRQLAEGPPVQLLFAAQLISEGGGSDSDYISIVIDRLVDLALGSGAITHKDAFSDTLIHSSRDDLPIVEPEEAFWYLGRLYGNVYVAERLRDIACRNEFPTQVRAQAAQSMGRIADPADACRVLKSVADSTREPALLAMIAKLMNSLAPGEARLAQDVLGRIGGSPIDTAQSGAFVNATDLLLKLSRPESGAILAWSVLETTDVLPEDAVRAIDAILAVEGSKAIPRLLAIADKWVGSARSIVRWILVQLVEFGARDDIAAFCRRAFSEGRVIRWNYGVVAGAWIMAAGPEALPEVTQILTNDGDVDSHAMSEVAIRLLQNGHANDGFDVAFKLLRSNINDVSDDHPDWEAAWICLSSLRPRSSKDVLELIKQLAPEDIDDYFFRESLAELIRLGQFDLVESLAWQSLTASWSRGVATRGHLVQVFRSCGVVDSIIEKLDHEVERNTRVGSKLDLIEMMIELGGKKQAAAAMRMVISNSRHWMGPDLEQAVRVLILLEGSAGCAKALSLVDDSFNYRDSRIKDLDRIANSLASQGYLESAANIWLEAIGNLVIPMEVSFGACAKLVRIGFCRRAVLALEAVLSSSELGVSERARLESMRSWAATHEKSEGEPTS